LRIGRTRRKVPPPPAQAETTTGAGVAGPREDDGLSAGEAMNLLVGSIAYADGQIHFQLPARYDRPADWNIHISGGFEFEDGFTASHHALDDENTYRTWEAGKRYSVPIYDDLTGLTMDIYLRMKTAA
jgi:hypothetical protein